MYSKRGSGVAKTWSGGKLENTTSKRPDSDRDGSLGAVLDYMRSVTLDPLLSRSSLIFLSFPTLNSRSRLLQIKFEVKDICITPPIVVSKSTFISRIFFN